ncbi:MAG: hypothetical protein KatS3mg082_2432 [Nitrospiraceae bacterium]|nr:MAG: hypothetical protein KatS3mg082_2432 [Nitrospiraceae bacterium]
MLDLSISEGKTRRRAARFGALREIVGGISVGTKRVIILAHDGGVAFLLSLLWHAIFYGVNTEEGALIGLSILSSGLLVLCQLIVGVDRLVVRRLGVRSGKRLAQAFVLYCLVLLAVELPILYSRDTVRWWSVLAIIALAAGIFMALVIARCLARWLLRGKPVWGRRGESRRFLIYGAGAAGVRLAANITDGGLGAGCGFFG